MPDLLRATVWALRISLSVIKNETFNKSIIPSSSKDRFHPNSQPCRGVLLTLSRVVVNRISIATRVTSSMESLRVTLKIVSKTP